MIEALRAITLTIRSERGIRVAELEWRDGVTAVVFATETMRPAVERWLEHGLREWVGAAEDATPRSTSSTSPDFLPRLEEYLAKQFRFRLTCRTVVELLPYTTTIITESLERDEWFAARGGVVFQWRPTVFATQVPGDPGSFFGGSITGLVPWSGTAAQIVASATGQMLFEPRPLLEEGLALASKVLTARRPS